MHASDIKGEETPNETATETSVAATQRPNERASKRITKPDIEGLGGHWGLMIIDKESEDARWLDGHLTLERRDESNRLYIKHIFKAAETAGKILRGYDTVMEREKRQFKTSTLKYTPHDHWDNLYKGDGGSACAPWVFAMLRYVLRNPACLTGEGGLKRAFKRSRKQTHVANLAFNSRQVRIDMQNLIAEEAARGESDDALPHKLTAPVLRAMHRLPESLLQFVTQGAFQPKQARKNHRHLPFPKEGSKDDDENHGDGYSDHYNGIPFEILKPLIRKDPTLTSSKRLAEAYDALQAQQRSVVDSAENNNDGNNMVSGKNRKSRKGKNESNQKGQNDEPSPAHGKEPGSGSGDCDGDDLGAVEDHIPSAIHDDPTVVEYAALQSSEAFVAIKNQTVAFVPMTPEEVNECAKKSSDQSFLDVSMDVWHQKMLLQQAFGSFGELSKDDAEKFRDELELDESLSHSQVIRELKGFSDHVPSLLGEVKRYPNYYLKRMGVLAANGSATLTRSKSKSGNRRKGDGADGSEAKARSKEPRLDRNTTRDSELQAESTAIKRDDWHWINVSDEDLEAALTEHITKHAKAGPNSNNYTYRAILCVQDGDSFNDAFAEECLNFWINDTNVFRENLDFKVDSDGKRTSLIEYQQIQTRMQAQYEAHEYIEIGSSDDDDDDDDDDEETDPKSSNGEDQDKFPGAYHGRDPGKDKSSSPLPSRDRMSGHYGTGPLTEMPGNSVDFSKTEQESDHDENPQAGKASGKTFNTVDKRKRDAKDGMSQGTSRTKRKKSCIGKSRCDNDSERSSSNASSSLSSPSPSESDSKEKETTHYPTSSESTDSNSDNGNSTAVSGNKRPRGPKDDSSEDQENTSKKPKTSHHSPSHSAQMDTDAVDSRSDQPCPTTSTDPKHAADCNGTTPSTQATSSFDSQATLEDPTIDIHIGCTVYTFNTNDPTIFLPWEETQQGWSSTTTLLQDFAHIDAMQLAAWYNANQDELKAQLDQRCAMHDTVTCRALLHRKFKRTFLHEPDARFSEVWINDSTVFDAAAVQELLAINNPEVRDGEIRRRMMQAYEPEMLRRIEASGVYRPGVPNVLDINVIGASRSTVADEEPVVDETLLRLPTVEEACLARRRERGREGTGGVRRGMRRRTPSRR